MNIRQFMKRKSISDNLSVENISDKRFRMEVQPAQTNGVERVEFCERPFALHREQPEKDSKFGRGLPWKNFCRRPWFTPGKISADAHGCTYFDLILGS